MGCRPCSRGAAVRCRRWFDEADRPEDDQPARKCRGSFQRGWSARVTGACFLTTFLISQGPEKRKPCSLKAQVSAPGGPPPAPRWRGRRDLRRSRDTLGDLHQAHQQPDPATGGQGLDAVTHQAPTGSGPPPGSRWRDPGRRPPGSRRRPPPAPRCLAFSSW